MARPIAATPRLDVKASKRFEKRMQSAEGRKRGPVPTPKIEQAIKLILEDAQKAKK